MPGILTRYRQRMVARFTAVGAIAAASLAITGAGAPAEDYLAQDLRASVEALKAAVERAPSTEANAKARAQLLWQWLNAYAQTGRYVPVNATATVSGILAYNPTGRTGRFAALDNTVRELAILDGDPAALGMLQADTGPFEARSYATIRQTFTVGTRDILPGGGFVVARHFMANFGRFQTDDPAADNHISIASSNSGVRFSRSTVPMGGMHGGFRRPVDVLMFRVASGRLSHSDTVTITYGDTTGGGRGLLMPDFSSDRMPLPLYLAFDESDLLVSLPIQPIRIVGSSVAGVHGFAPSVVAVGEPVELAVRAEDRFYNRAVGPIPGWSVFLNGEPFADVEVGGEAIQILKGSSFDTPGVYRFSFRSRDGTVTGDANPILVEDDPARRIYWGDTHGHSGFAEGIGTPERFMVWARDDARLDYVTHSEHDIWMEDFEWDVLADNVRRFTKEGEFIAFLGYEWTIRNFQGGHHNVLFRTPDGRRRIPAQEFGTLSLLYQGLRTHHDAEDVVVIPHAHQAGDYRLNDPLLEPLVEIMSQHGTFEWFGRMYLNHGHEVGFVAASDNHLSQPGYSAPKPGSLSGRAGLGALRADARTRDALFDAMRDLATYATTGDRMILDVSVNGGEMGTRVPFAEKRLIEGRVIGTAPIDTITVVKNDEEIWQRDYLTDVAPRNVADGEFHLVFASDSTPFHPNDNPRGWRWWRGTIEVEGATVADAQGQDFHNTTAHRLEVTDGGVGFATYTRGGTSSIKLTLADVRRGARLILALGEAREFGSGPPVFRAHRDVPAREVVLELRNLERGSVTQSIPFDGYVDTVTLRRAVTDGVMDVEFEIEDEGGRHGDYYYVRITQANDAIAWSSPIWVGGFPKR